MTGTGAFGRVPLPVDDVLPGVIEALRRRPVLVLAAPPGSGKTTRVPPAILDAGLCGQGEVIVVQPRRLAARMAARRVAAERGEAPGGTVGWKVRFEEVGGSSTRLWYVTEGVLVRRLLADPTLAGVGAVVLDEFHERSLDADLALALLRRLRAGPRPDLLLVIMSATLDAEGLAATLDATAVRAEGRRFDVAVEYAARPDARPLEARVAESVERLVAANHGDILVFLPGAAEIRRAREACADLARRSGRLVLPLHGDLPPEEQDRAVLPGDRPKVILATNVAETSITVEGVTAVVDSGLARRLVHSPWSGMPSLRVQPVSKASAEQRAGRAGRVRPGCCVRLFTRSEYDGRPDADAPEIARADLADAVLLLHAAGIEPATGVPWLDPPPRAALEAAEGLLQRLGLAGSDGRVTDLGVQVARLPAHPRLGRLVAEAAARGRLPEGCLLAAVLAERDVRRSTGSRRLLMGHAMPGPGSGAAPVSDLPDGFLDPVETVAGLGAGGRHADLDPAAVSVVRRAAVHMEAQARRAGLCPAAVVQGGSGAGPGDLGRVLTLSLLAGFPDRVGRVRRSILPGLARAGALELALSSGGTADLPADALLPEGRLVIAADATERAGARGQVLRVRSARPWTTTICWRAGSTRFAKPSRCGSCRGPTGWNPYGAWSTTAWCWRSARSRATRHRSQTRWPRGSGIGPSPRWPRNGRILPVSWPAWPSCEAAVPTWACRHSTTTTSMPCGGMPAAAADRWPTSAVVACRRPCRPAWARGRVALWTPWRRRRSGWPEGGPSGSTIPRASRPAPRRACRTSSAWPGGPR